MKGHLRDRWNTNLSFFYSSTILSSIIIFGLIGPILTENSNDKPAMGWNSFPAFECKIDERTMGRQVDLINEKQLSGSGYKTFVLECGWEGKTRKDGTPSTYRKRFRSGMKAFGDHVRNNGLRLGVLSPMGGEECRGKKRKKKRAVLEKRKKRGVYDPKKYLQTLVDWGTTHIRHRPCYWAAPWLIQDPEASKRINNRYIEMANLVRDLKRPDMIYAAGVLANSPEANNIKANSYRISHDNLPYWFSITSIINSAAGHLGRNGPSGFRDLHTLHFGKSSLTQVEKLTQFIFWAAAKSPLIFSNKIEDLDQSDLDILKHKATIDINQDPKAKGITLKRRYTDEKDVWAGTTGDGSVFAVIINWKDSTENHNVLLSDVGLSEARVIDIWTGQDYGVIKDNHTFIIGPHACVFVKFTESKPAPPRKFKKIPAEKGDTMGSAYLRNVNDKDKAISNIDQGGYSGARFVDVDGGGEGGRVLVSFDYSNAELAVDVQYSLIIKRPYRRRAVITVNDTDKTIVEFPISGPSWQDITRDYLVELPGFYPGESNKVLIEGYEGWAPDIVSLGVLENVTPAA